MCMSILLTQKCVIIFKKEVIFMKNYGFELKQQRIIYNLSQTQLSKATGISQQNISRWESNKVIPSIEHCEILANFYGITIDELIGR